jgi:hypothetical protein
MGSLDEKISSFVMLSYFSETLRSVQGVPGLQKALRRWSEKTISAVEHPSATGPLQSYQYTRSLIKKSSILKVIN